MTTTSDERTAFEKWQDAPDTKWPEYDIISAQLVFDAWKASRKQLIEEIVRALEGEKISDTADVSSEKIKYIRQGYNDAIDDCIAIVRGKGEV